MGKLKVRVRMGKNPSSLFGNYYGYIPLPEKAKLLRMGIKLNYAFIIGIPRNGG